MLFNLGGSPVPLILVRLGVLSHFRVQFHDCPCTRADAPFELTDAVLCAEGPVASRRLRRRLAPTPRARGADGRIVLAVDVSNWLRPDAPAGPDLLFCHVHGRGRSTDRTAPGRPQAG
ncbi:hypothetical protein C1I97_36975 [Streptomyces sp. NTH33]|nr:hypothetical protein C1I97_36975 [Streptomyces sp. NTH33]